MTRPLTPKEREIAELVGDGLPVKQVHAELAKRGRFLAISTLETRIRVIALKLDNPHGLPPMAIIRLWIGTNRAA